MVCWCRSSQINIKDSTNIKLEPLKTLLSHADTKSQLTQYLGRALLHEYAASSESLVVVYGTSTYSNKADVFNPNIDEHSHEEADTLIPIHVLDAFKTDGSVRDIDSSDTDVFVFLMDLFATNNIRGNIHFITGKVNVNVNICNALEFPKEQNCGYLLWSIEAKMVQRCFELRLQ